MIGHPSRRPRRIHGDSIAKEEPHDQSRSHRPARRSHHRHIALHPSGPAGDLPVRRGPERTRPGRGRAAGRLQVAALPRRRGTGHQLHRLHAAGIHTPQSPAPAAGRHPLDRNRPSGPHRHRHDHPQGHGDHGAPLRPLPARGLGQPRERIPAGHRPGRRIRALRGPGARGRVGRRLHRSDRRRHRHPRRLLRTGHRRAAARLRPGRPEAHREAPGIPPSSEGRARHGRSGDAGPVRGARARPAGRPPARPAGLHRLAPGRHRRRAARRPHGGRRGRPVRRRRRRARPLRSAAPYRRHQRLAQHLR